MKILFISEFLVYGEACGAKSLTKAHYEILKEIVGVDNLDCVVPLWKEEWVNLNYNPKFQCLSGFKNRFGKIYNIVNGNVYLVSNSMINSIVDMIDRNGYDVILFGNTLYGKILRKVKKRYPNIKLVQFFHGVNINSRIIQIKDDIRNIKTLPQLVAVYYNEYLSIKYSDVNILLNERDNRILEKYYKKTTDKFLPCFFSDKGIDFNNKIKLEGDMKLLFVGGYFWPNINGVIWFATNVMAKLNDNIKLYIIGNKMELLRNESIIANNNNIIVVGGVEDLTPWYNSADIVVGPIFDGDGMKTKTAEAMMYGKVYLGTPESFCGYRGMKQYECQTHTDFINKIDYYYENGVSKYNEEIRLIYTKYYSDLAAKENLKKILFE